MSQDGGFIKCDDCGLWIDDGDVHSVDDCDYCGECWSEREKEAESEG